MYLQTLAVLAGLCLTVNTMANIPKKVTDNEVKTVNLRVIQTSDVHGSFFPYDFINRRPRKGSLARVSTYVNQLRQTYGKNLILLDNGDILQGQPTCYYCNYVKPDIENVEVDFGDLTIIVGPQANGKSLFLELFK